MSARNVLRLSAALVSIATSPVLHAAHGTLPRFPNASAEHIVFVAGGNLWIVGTHGGRATQLTNDPGQVLMPRLSPDDRRVAFTWRRAGTEDVYVMPAAGGEPKRLTFGPSQGSYDNLVSAWTPDAKRIMFISQRRARFYKQFAAYGISPDGGLPEPLPFDHMGLLSFSPDGESIAFDPTFRNFGGDKWKRYEGGQAPDIYTYDFKTKASTRITDWKGIDTAPMWWRNRIYYLSDRDAQRRANIWVYDLDTKQTRQITHYTDFDVDVPSLGADVITFQQGGRLVAIDLPSETLRPIDVTLDPGDRVKARSVDAAAFLRRADLAGEADYAISPDGHSAILVARGDLLRADANTAVNLTSTPSVDEDHPSLSPDGQRIAYITDQSGEQQVASRPVGGGHARLLSHIDHGVLYTPRWSPDGQKLVIADGKHRLWMVDVDGAATTLIASDPYAEIHDAHFSTDSRWLAYSTLRANQLRAIHLREIATGKDQIVSSDMNSDREPVFSSDGRRLFFISKRHELPIISDRDQETDIATLKSDGVYVTTLAENSLPAFGTASRVDLPGLMARAIPLPVTAGDVTQLESRGDRLFYRAQATALIEGELPGDSSGVHVLNLSTGDDRVIAADADRYSLSADGVIALIERGRHLHWIDTGNGADHEVTLAGAHVPVDPHKEWREMFEQAWRLDRDLFWNPMMNGVDWQRAHDTYSKLVPLIGSHEDFMYLLGELQGELANSHMFIGRGDDGDSRTAQRPALLGADYALDADSGRYRIIRIFRGDNTRARFAAPLGRAQPAVAEGTYLLAINGRELVAPDDPFAALQGTTGEVTLTLSATPDGLRRVVMVQPIASEVDVRQLDWVERNRRSVDQQSGGRVGYVYLTDFSEDGSEDFVRQFYPQIDKQGLIFDVRWNGGGFTSQWVLGILRRRLAGQFVNREGASTTLPGSVPPPAMVVLTNKFSASDGDQFPYFFREYGLGKVIGERTWGGVRGIKGPWTLLDGTFMTVPKDSLYSLQSRWIIENHGTEPDIEFADGLLETGSDADALLAAGVQQVIATLDAQPAVSVRPPPLLPSYPAAGDVPPASFGGPSPLH